MWRSVALILVLCGALAGCSWSGDHQSAGVIHSKVVPRKPLSFAECMREAHGWGYSVAAARQFDCTPSASRAPWFHATFTNLSALGTYIRCTFTAWGKNGRQLFHNWLPLTEVSVPAGMYLRPHQTRSIDWYFDSRSYPDAARHAHAVARYTTACNPLKNPPI
jgi:hypothetical protein